MVVLVQRVGEGEIACVGWWVSGWGGEWGVEKRWSENGPSPTRRMVSDGVKGIVGRWVSWVGCLGVDLGLGLDLGLDFEIGL